MTIRYRSSCTISRRPLIINITDVATIGVRLASTTIATTIVTIVFMDGSCSALYCKRWRQVYLQFTVHGGINLLVFIYYNHMEIYWWLEVNYEALKLSSSSK